MTAVNKFPQAEDDLINIWVRIASDSPFHADRYLDHLDAKMQLLAEFPHLGRLHPELGQGLRGFPVDDYLIFYRQVESGVDIVRVLHGARDIQALFHTSDHQPKP